MSTTFYWKKRPIHELDRDELLEALQFVCSQAREIFPLKAPIESAPAEPVVSPNEQRALGVGCRRGNTWFARWRRRHHQKRIGL